LQQEKVGQWLRHHAKGVTMLNLNTTIIRDLPFVYPPLEEQRRIAEVLDRAEALRAKRRAALAQLDTLTQSIFLALFGDPDENPKAWPIQQVSDYVAEFQGGKSLEAEGGENVAARNRVLKISAVTSTEFEPDENKPVPDSYEPPSDHFVRPGDLLFSRANTTELVGAVAYVERTPPNLLLPDKLWRFVWRDPAAVEPLFVRTLFHTPAVRREIARRATGTSGSMKNISQEKLFGIRTILPPLSIQTEFVRRGNAVDKLKSVHRASLAKLDALFASLQHRAFRGEL
jgi:type I restriction enzyme S subunit